MQPRHQQHQRPALTHTTRHPRRKHRIGSSTATNFIVTNTRNVGIGTTSPWGLLSVNANGIGTAPQFVVGSSTYTSFLIDNGGRVGVGTTSPYAQFSIFAASSSNGVGFRNLTLFAIGSSTSLGATSTLFMVNNTGFVGVGTTTPWALVSINPSGIGTAPAFAIGSSSATSFLVTNGGRVGIGTTSPAYALDVNGD
jgi:hypothetical protein